MIYINWTGSLEFPPWLLLLLEELASCWGAVLRISSGICLIINHFWIYLSLLLHYDLTSSLAYRVSCIFVGTCRMDRRQILWMNSWLC
jgi:hypothetical protein